MNLREKIGTVIANNTDPGSIRIADVLDQIMPLVETEKAFRRHIKTHLASDEQVICKICGRSAEEIVATAQRKLIAGGDS